MPTPLALGSIVIDRVVEQESLPFMPFTQFFPAVTAEMLAAERGWLEPNYLDAEGKLLITVQSYVVRTKDLTILVDTCVGNHKARPTRAVWNMRTSDLWENNLAGLGLTVNDIDIVMCTHLHGDHVGWNTRLENGRWVPTFPKARYLFADRELDFWSKRAKDNPESCPWVQDSVLPIVEAKRAEIVTSAHELSDELRLVPTPGHTIDHFSVEIGKEAAGPQALITGDMVHSPIQIKYPEIGMLSDYDSKQAGETRQRVFAHCCDAGSYLCTAHFPGNPVGRLKREGSAYRFTAE